MTRLLVVDDSAMDRRRVGGLLERRSEWNIHYANDGQDALRQIEMHLPEIVLTDLQMPELDGLQLVEAVRRDYPLVPVILMTAQGSEEVAVRALQAGAASYVPKKDLARELLDTVERILAASSKDRGSSRLAHRIRRHELQYELENDLSLFPPLVEALQQAAGSFRLHEGNEVVRVGVALEEALLNAYYHGNLEVSSELRQNDHSLYYDLARQRSQQEPYRDRKIFVSAKFTTDEATYVIRDEGPGFRMTDLPNLADPLHLERPSGRGLLLMKTFMDEVRFNSTGNEVTLSKRRQPLPELSKTKAGQS